MFKEDNEGFRCNAYLSDELKTVACKFCLNGEIIDCQIIKGGLINKTYVVKTTNQKYVLQWINCDVFHNIDLLMDNIKVISEYFYQNKWIGLKIIKTKDGNNYFFFPPKNYWRMYEFINDTYTLDAIRNRMDAKQYGYVIGNFLIQMKDINHTLIHNTIENFHDTPFRYKIFIDAVNNDVKNRAISINSEIDYIFNQWKFIESMAHLLSLIKEGIVHNDARINNVLFDNVSNGAVCLIDYDTIMLGKRIIDFCDGFRFATTYDSLEYMTTQNVEINYSLFRAYLEGYIAACGNILTREEFHSLLPISKLITLENGIRLLTDFLNGDTYFYTEYSNQNLIRWLRHRQLLDSFERNVYQLENILKEIG